MEVKNNESLMFWRLGDDRLLDSISHALLSHGTESSEATSLDVRLSSPNFIVEDLCAGPAQEVASDF